MSEGPGNVTAGKENRKAALEYYQSIGPHKQLLAIALLDMSALILYDTFEPKYFLDINMSLHRVRIREVP